MDTDPDTANWVLEFLLRQSLEDRMLKSLLRSLHLPNDNLNLKKTLLLKKLESDTLRTNSVSVTTLELLEQLEETEYLQGNETVSDTMKHAYCAAAVECTVKNLKAVDGEDKSKRFGFFEAVKTVWRGKIARMKKIVEKGGLVSKELWAWRDEIEEAVWDDEACESVVMKSEGINGVEAVNAYLKEEREKIGPSFLELVAERVERDEVLQGIMGVDGIDVVAGKEAPPSSGVNEVAGGSNASKEMNGGKIKLREKHLVLRRSRGLPSGNIRGAKIVDPDETTNEPSDIKYNVPGSAEVVKAREALELSSLDLKAVVKDPLPDALKLAQEISEEARNSMPQLPASTAGVAQAPVGNTSNEPRPSLMERNSTAHTCEWDESIDESQEDRARLPSPRRINTSPLNQYQIVKQRRKPRKWSLHEEDTLRTEVNTYGKGQWKLILNLNRDTFEGRTEVDLKDKWRNMIH